MPSILGTNGLAEVAGSITDFFEKLAGPDGNVWLDAFKKFLRKEPTWVAKVAESAREAVKRVLTPFITITTGGTTADQLIADIEAMPAEATSYAKSMMDNKAFTISKENGKADLVILTVAELGSRTRRTDEWMTDEFCAQFSAKYLDGYVIELCQPEDGPKLRKQWKDQPKGMTVWLAMKHIAVSVGNPYVFFVEHDDFGGRWLCGGWVCGDRVWNPGYRVVFRLRKI